MRRKQLLQYINQHFKVKLILSLSVIIIVCSIVTGYVSYRINLNLFEGEISKQYRKTSEQTIEQIGFKIQDVYRITDFVFFHPLVEQLMQQMHAPPAAGESEAFRDFRLERELADMLLTLKNETQQIRAVYIVDTQGINRYYSQTNSAFQIKFPDFYQLLRSSMKPTSAEIAWQRMKIADSSGQKSYIVAARLLKSTKQQTVYGMMILIIDEAYFGNSLEPLMAGRTTGAYLYDQNGELLYSREPEGDEGFQPTLAGSDDTFIEHHNKSDYLFVRSEFAPRSFTLVSGISLADIKAKGRNVYQLALVSGLVSVLLMAFSVSFFSGKMLKPLQVLVGAMQRVREGNLHVVIPKTTDDEFAYLSERFNEMVANIQALIQEVYVSKLSEKEAELKSLQAQLNPHFLHNSLNTIYWQIMYLYDDAETASLVSSLSELLKYSLAPATTPSTLQDELAQIRNYMTIQEARHGEELYVTIEADEDILQCRMQRLLMQPLIENVFIHAFRDQTANKRLAIRAFRRHTELHIEIEDNGCGMPQETIDSLLDDRILYDERRERESIGVRNVIRRIDLVHGAPYGLDIRRLPQGTLIRLTLPYETKEGGKGDDTHTAG